MDKRGLELMFNTYIVIVLGILALIILALFWDMQTGLFSGYINQFMGKSNVDVIIASCNSLATRQASYEYCCAKKEVRYGSDNKIIKEMLTCSQLSSMKMGARIEEMECGNVC